jgi:hypothetical protein
MTTLICRRLAVLAAVFCLAGWGTTAHADWAACQRKPTRACLLEEALRGDGAPLAGKDRLDVLILADAAGHPEYATAADIDEAVQQGKVSQSGFNYLNLAIRGLVAANQKQQAVDLVASLPSRASQYYAFVQLTRALAKAGDLDTAAALLDRLAPTLDASARGLFGHVRVIESVRLLAEAGRIDDALLVIVLAQSGSLLDVDVPEMLMMVAQAYASRGDTVRTRQILDRIGPMLEKAQRYAIGINAEAIRWEFISRSALRGDAAAVRTALQELPPESTDRLAANLRNQGYQQVVAALLKTKQFPLALEVARSSPASARDQALLMINTENAANGRIDDARAVMALFSEKMDPKTRAIAVRNVAVAMVKAGKLAAAVEMAAQASDPVGRKAVLFAIAQALPQ